MSYLYPSNPNITTMCSSPPASSVVTIAFGTTLTSGTAKRNTLGYDILVNINVPVSLAVSGIISIGIGATSTPSVSALTNTLIATGILNFSAIVPNNYYLMLSTSGTITLGTITLQACGI